MNKADKDRYYVPMKRYLEGKVPKGVIFDKWLESQIGVDVYGQYLLRSYKDDFPLPDELRKLFTAMTGPHWRTVLRVYQIRKGLRHG